MNARFKSQLRPQTPVPDKKRRLNIYLPLDLDRRARLYAAERCTNLSSLVADGLERILPVRIRVVMAPEPTLLTDHRVAARKEKRKHRKAGGRR